VPFCCPLPAGPPFGLTSTNMAFLLANLHHVDGTPFRRRNEGARSMDRYSLPDPNMPLQHEPHSKSRCLWFVLPLRSEAKPLERASTKNSNSGCITVQYSSPHFQSVKRVCRRLDVETLFQRCLPMVFSLETSSSRYSSSVTIHRIGGTPREKALPLARYFHRSRRFSFRLLLLHFADCLPPRPLFGFSFTLRQWPESPR